MTDMHADIRGVGNQQSVQGTGGEIERESGTYNGAEVAVAQKPSLLEQTMDAMEETVSLMSETTEKEVSDREVESGEKSESLERILKLKELMKLSKALGDLNQDDLKNLLKALLKRGTKNPDELKRAVEDAFDEPSHQYAALQGLIAGLEERGADPDAIKAARDAAAQLMEARGADIRAAINIGETAGEFGGELGGHQALRDTYRSNVQDYQSISAVMQDLTKRFGDQSIEVSIAFMVKALGADLASGGPSIDRAKLAVINSDLQRLKALTTILDNCRFVVKQVHDRGDGKGYTGEKLMADMVPFLDASWVSGDQVTSVAQRIGFDDIEHQINFLTDLFNLSSMIPESACTRPENKDKLRDGVQQAIDAAVKIEDEEEFDDEDEEEVNKP